MADSSATLRRLGVAHILVGILLVSLGIADRFEGFFWTGYLYFGIWIGTWVSFPHYYRGFARMSDSSYRFLETAAEPGDFRPFCSQIRYRFLPFLSQIGYGFCTVQLVLNLVCYFRRSYFLFVTDKISNKNLSQCI